jgi:hypothetical protein
LGGPSEGPLANGVEGIVGTRASPRVSGTAIVCGTSLFNGTLSPGRKGSAYSLVGWEHFKICREFNNLCFPRYYDSAEWDAMLIDKLRDLIDNCLKVVFVGLPNARAMRSTRYGPEFNFQEFDGPRN